MYFWVIGNFTGGSTILLNVKFKRMPYSALLQLKDKIVLSIDPDGTVIKINKTLRGPKVHIVIPCQPANIDCTKNV